MAVDQPDDGIHCEILDRVLYTLVLNLRVLLLPCKRLEPGYLVPDAHEQSAFAQCADVVGAVIVVLALVQLEHVVNDLFKLCKLLLWHINLFKYFVYVIPCNINFTFLSLDYLMHVLVHCFLRYERVDLHMALLALTPCPAVALIVL